MTRSALLFCLALALAAAGCARIPQPSTFMFSDQQKMQAAHHWEVLANNVADQINHELIRQGYLETPVFVRHTCNRPDPCAPGATTPFDEGFNDLLISQLVNFGIPTQAKPGNGALTVEYKVQVVHHQSGRIRRLWPGVLTALTSSVIVLQDAPWEAIALAAAATGDLTGGTLTVDGHYEVIISASIVHDNLYLMRKSSIYYVNDPDFWHYQPSTPAARIPLSSGPS